MVRFQMFILAAVITAAVSAAHATGLLLPLEVPFIRFFSHTGGYGYASAVAVRNSIGRIEKTHDETIITLEQKINELERDAALLKELQAENDILKKQLSFIDERQIEVIVARVIGAGNDSAHSTLLLDHGSADGVQEAAPVIAGKGVLIGKARHVLPHSSEVVLLNDNGSRVTAEVVNAKKSKGVLEGQFQIGLRMSLIPSTDPLERGMAVVTGGIETGLPKGLLIGYISEIQSKATDLFQTAAVTPALDYNDTPLVSVIKKYQQQ